jgi:predicted lipid carrier protein YhbT
MNPRTAPAPRTLTELAARAASDPRAVSPADLAAVVAATPVAQLRAAAGGGLRDLAIDIVLGRLEEFVTPARWTGAPVRLALRLTGRGSGGADTVVLTLDGVTARAARAGADGAAPADVTIEADALDLLLLVTGQEHAALLFLRGGLRLDGDVHLAIAAAGCFQIPGVAAAGARGAAGSGAGRTGELDPLAIDANAVAAVVRELSDGELRARMAGGVRDIVLGEIFGRFGDHLRRDRTADVDAAIGWRITGREDGGVDEFLTRIDHGTVVLAEPGSVRPRVSIQVEAADFLRLVTGNANPAMMFMRRRISVRGDLGFAAQLTGMFRIPSR